MDILKRSKINAFDILFCIFMAAFVYWVVFYSRFVSFIGSDLSGYFYAPMAANARSIAENEFMLWNPYLWGGYSAVGHAISQTFYPITLLLCKLFYIKEADILSFGAIFGYISIHIYIYVISMYALLRALKLNQFACAISAICGTFCYGFWETVYWPAFFSGQTLLPIIILFSVLYMRDDTNKSCKYIVFTGISFGLCGLGTQTGSLFMNIMFFGFLLLFCLWDYRQEMLRVKSILFKTFIVGLIGFGFCAISLIPVLEFSFQSYRYVPDIGFINSMEKMPFEDFIKHSTSITSLDDIFMNFNSAKELSTGATFGIFLILSFFIKKCKNPSVFYFATTSFIVALLYSISFVFTDIFYYLPLLNSIREPYLYAPYAIIFGTIMVAFSIDYVLDIYLVDRSNQQITDIFTSSFVLAFIVGIVVVIYLLPLNFVGIKSIVFVLCLLTLIVTLLLRINNKMLFREAKYLALLSILIMASIDVYDDVRLKNSLTFNKKEAVAAVQKVDNNIREFFADDLPFDDNFYRVAQYSGAYPENSMAVLGFYGTTGYMNPMHTRSLVSNSLYPPLKIPLQNIKYLLFPDTVNEDLLNYVIGSFENLEKIPEDNKIYMVYSSPEPTRVQVYKNNDIGDPAWMVYEYETYGKLDTGDDVVNRMVQEGFDVKSKALVNIDTLNDEIVITAQGKESKARIIKYSPNTVTMHVTTDQPGILVTTDPYYDGWKAYVNGKKSDIFEVDYINRAVFVERGESIVEFRYEPTSLKIGILFFAMSSVLSLFILCFKGTFTRNILIQHRNRTKAN